MNQGSQRWGSTRRWEQIQWNIQNNSTANRIQRIEDDLKHIGDGEQQILARAGRVREVEKFPHSIVTSLPKKMKGRWDKNKKKTRDKIETATKALKLRQTLFPDEIRRIQEANREKHLREEEKTKGRSQYNKKRPLQNITNIKGQRKKIKSAKNSEDESKRRSKREQGYK